MSFATTTPSQKNARPDNAQLNSLPGLSQFSAPSLPEINLPKGGGAIRSIGEKFQVNAINGSSSFSIPLPLAAARNGPAPSVALSYSSGNGNSPFGLGWQLSYPLISRKTENGLPQYKDEEESDCFMLSGAEDLVPQLEQQPDGGWKRVSLTIEDQGIPYRVKRYRPRIDNAFARIEKWQHPDSGETHWRTISPDNLHSIYGRSANSRISDPANPLHIFQWLICESFDDKGNIVVYQYKKEDFAGIDNRLSEQNRPGNCTQVYLKKVLYGNKNAWYLNDPLPPENDFMFSLLFDYGEHPQDTDIPQHIHTETRPWPGRKDPFSSCRSGFEIRSYRRCSRVMCFHQFDELPVSPYLTSSVQLIYADELNSDDINSSDTGFSMLARVRHNGHSFDSLTNQYSTQSLPELDIFYHQHEWNHELKTATEDAMMHIPGGLSDRRKLWTDLFNEGLSGILIHDSAALYYKYNLGNGNFSPAMPLSSFPRFSSREDAFSLQETEGNGIKYLVQLDRQPRGFYKLNEENSWEAFRPFESVPNLNLADPGTRFIDLTGDGKVDILHPAQDQVDCYFSEGEKGFSVAHTLVQQIDEEKGPAIVFSDSQQGLFLADMNGDGLTDIVRIRNSEICYWPNIGYGKFGRKVAMDNAPYLDDSNSFNPAMLRLADIDGSGTIDLIYLGRNDFRIWLNHNGNGWSAEPRILPAFPAIDNLADVAVLDFLGSGTGCIVHSSPLAGQPVHYIDLMNSRKPHLFCGYANNCGLEVSIDYQPSTWFYLKDKQEGRPWITRLPFPVHCIRRVRTEDKIRQTVFTSTYAYSHGCYDFTEGEFRGFARVEQEDTEVFEQFSLNDALNVVEEALHQPPVRTVSWQHTGAYERNRTILHQCQHEYFQNTAFAEYILPNVIVTGDASAEELAEAFRACKSLGLRSEVYSSDGSHQQHFPYTTSGSSYEIRMLQPKGINPYAVFMVIPRETILYTYDRIPDDPRILHSFILDTDERGNITRSATVVYPRVKRPEGAEAIPDKVWDTQHKLSIACGEISYTNDIDDKEVYRLRVACETKSFEVNGIPQPDDFYFSRAGLEHELSTASPILFETDFDGSRQKRLAAHSRSYFLKDDLSGPLGFGVLSALALPHKAYQLIFTKELATKYHGSKLTDQLLQDAGYVHLEGDEHWWAQPGESIFGSEPEKSFYIPRGERDVFGNEHFIEYDTYHLLPVKTTDAIGNVSTAVNNYRTLTAELQTDLNLNQTAVETDALGMVTRVVVIGKAGSGEGDSPNDPTMKLSYDLFNWKLNGRPNFMHTFTRERHGAENTRWQENIAYTDGGGGVILSKSKVHAGKARRWNVTLKQVEEVESAIRWIGNGRTIINNKGNPVKRYDPYFSTNSDYEREEELIETGFSTITFYDAISRNIRTEFPDGTFTRIAFSSWRNQTFDASDTVTESSWYSDRGSPDIAGAEPTDPQTRAAWLSAKHAHTPETTHADVLGGIVYVETDYGEGNRTAVFSETDAGARFTKVYDQLNRMVSETYTNLAGQVIYARSSELGERWFFSDTLGRPVRIWDNNLREMYGSFDKLHRPVSSFVLENNIETLCSHIVYGDQLPAALAEQKNLKGGVHMFFDQSGMMRIDALDFNGNVLRAERRLCKAYKQNIDWSGLVNSADPAAILSIADPQLEEETFLTAGRYDALGRPLSVTLPDNSMLEPEYNEAGFLSALRIQLLGEGHSVSFFEGQDYNAKGQRQFAKFGNGSITSYFYDARSFQLTRLLTKANEGDDDAQSIQQLHYTYDASGNIVQIRDDAQQTHFFTNAVVLPEQKFEYDAGYRLVRASGREHAGLNGHPQPNHGDLPFIPQLPHQNDAQAMRNYTERYSYDACGNITRLQHIAGNASWTRRYQYQYETNAADTTNRLQAISLPGDAEGIFSGTFMHDASGNMTSMPHLAAPGSLKWNYQQQLTAADLGGGGMVYYVYAADGTRIRKIIERPGGKKLERVYLGPVEIYRESTAGGIEVERYSLQVSDGSACIAQVDTKTIDSINSDPDNQLGVPNIRYQYGNHIGSATLETDENGTIISYEEYHPYGTSSYRSAKAGTNLSLKRYRYCGKERDDETGLYYYGARYYASWLARWISSDPAGFADGLNLYRYCSNNPVMYIDPSGTEDIRIVKQQKFSGEETLEQLEKEIPKGYKLKPGITKDNYKDAWIPPNGSRGGVWNIVVPEDYVEEEAAPEPESTSKEASIAVATGSQVIRNNPPGATLSVQDTIDRAKMRRLKEGVRRREVGRNAGRGNSTRIRRNSPAQQDALAEFRQRRPAPTRPPAGGGSWQAGHRIDLQYDLTGRVGSNWKDYVWEPSGSNVDDGFRGWNRLRRHPQGVPVGGVAKATQASRFWNTPGFRTFGRYTGGGILGAGTIFSGFSFSNDISEGNWGSATLSGTGTAAGLLEIGGWAAKSSRLVAAGRFLGAPGAVISSGLAGWEFGTFIRENSSSGQTAQSAGEWAQENVWNNVYFGATVAAGTAIVTAPYHAGEAIGNRVHDYFTTDKYTLVPWRASWWPF